MGIAYIDPLAGKIFDCIQSTLNEYPFINAHESVAREATEEIMVLIYEDRLSNMLMEISKIEQLIHS